MTSLVRLRQLMLAIDLSPEERHFTDRLLAVVSEDEFSSGTLEKKTRERLGVRSPKLTKILPHGVSSIYGLLTREPEISIVRFEDTNDERYILHQSDTKHFSSCMRSGAAGNDTPRQYRTYINQDIRNFRSGNLILAVAGNSWHEDGIGYEARVKLRKVVASRKHNKLIGFFVEPIYGDTTTLHSRMGDILDKLKELYREPDLQLFSVHYRQRYQDKHKPTIYGYVKGRTGYRDTRLSDLRSKEFNHLDCLHLYNFNCHSVLTDAYRLRYRCSTGNTYNRPSISFATHRISQKNHSLLTPYYSQGKDIVICAPSYRYNNERYGVSIRTAIPWLRANGFKCKHYADGGWTVRTPNDDDCVLMLIAYDNYQLVLNNQVTRIHTHYYTQEELTNADECSSTSSYRRNIRWTHTRRESPSTYISFSRGDRTRRAESSY